MIVIIRKVKSFPMHVMLLNVTPYHKNIGFEVTFPFESNFSLQYQGFIS